MRDEDIYYVPDDVLKEIEEAERELRKEVREKKRRSKYPSSRDIVEAVIEVAKMFAGENPEDYPDAVIRYLEEKNFDTRHVTVKRIWRTYEKLVRTGVIADYLNVVR